MKALKIWNANEQEKNNQFNLILMSYKKLCSILIEVDVTQFLFSFVSQGCFLAFYKNAVLLHLSSHPYWDASIDLYTISYIF